MNVLDRKKESNIKRSSSMFISGTQRAAQDQNTFKQQAANPPIGTYNAQQYTIQDNLRKRLEAGVGNPLLANLKAKRGVGAAFSSNADRFVEKRDEAETYLGPGYYEQ